MSAKRKLKIPAAPTVESAPLRVASAGDFADGGARSPARQYQAMLAARLDEQSHSKYPLAARFALIGGGSLLLWGLIITATVAALR